MNLLGPRSLEKGSYHSNRLYNLLYSGNLVSLLGGVFVIGVLLVVIVVIKGIIIPCFSFMLTLMNNVEKDAATRTNTGKTEKETRPNQPAREPSPPSTREPSTLRTTII